MRIDDNPRKGISLKWKFKARDKQRRIKGKYGVKQCFHGVDVRIPNEMIPLISNDGVSTYVYEDFEKVCLVPEKPKNEKYQKMKITSKETAPTSVMEVPTKIFETDTAEYVTFEYFPNRKDNGTGREGSMIIDVGGYNPRKFIKRKIDLENATFTYTEHVQTINTPEGIHLHEDLRKILDPNRLYVYMYDGEFYLTDVTPHNTSYMMTDEENLKDDLIRNNVVSYDQELIQFRLYVNEKDIYSINPKIKILQNNSPN